MYTVRFLIIVLMIQLVVAQPLCAQSVESLPPATTGAVDAGVTPPAPALSFSDPHTVIDSQTLQGMSTLSVGSGQTVVIDFSNNGSVTLPGNITNAGSIFAVSNNSAVSTATIAGANLYNQQGSLLTTVLPSGGLPGFTGLLGNFSLSLIAAQNIVNAGVISSAGNLNVTAGGTITNALPVNVTGLQPVMQAAQNLNLISGAGSIINSGLIQSVAGNININTIIPTNLTINNAGGTIQALMGNINVRDMLFNGTNNIDLIGGDYHSQHLNLYSGTGDITAYLGDVTGIVNTIAGLEHISASTENLLIGNNCISGDPTFANTTGSITISGANVFSDNVAILAKNSISFGANASISAVNHHVTLLAGSAVTTTGTPIGTTLDPANNTTASIGPGFTASANFSSPTGGNIVLSSNNNITGKNITLVANSGAVFTNSSTIAATGDVNVLATSTITLGSINADGNVYIANATPKGSSSMVVTYNDVGVEQAGQTILANTYSAGSYININGAISGDSVIMQTTDIQNAGSVSSRAGGILALDNRVTGTDLFIHSTPAACCDGTWNTNGGKMMISSASNARIYGIHARYPVNTQGGDFVIVTALDIYGGDPTYPNAIYTSGGNMTLIAGAQNTFTITSPGVVSLAITGPTPTGNAQVNLFRIPLDTSSTTGPGGNVLIATLSGTSATRPIMVSENINTNSSVGAAGNIKVWSGTPTGSGILDDGTLANFTANGSTSALGGTVEMVVGNVTATGVSFSNTGMTGTVAAASSGSGTISLANTNIAAQQITIQNGTGNVNAPRLDVPVVNVMSSGSVTMNDSGVGTVLLTVTGTPNLFTFVADAISVPGSIATASTMTLTAANGNVTVGGSLTTAANALTVTATNGAIDIAGSTSSGGVTSFSATNGTTVHGTVTATAVSSTGPANLNVNGNYLVSSAVNMSTGSYFVRANQIQVSANITVTDGSISLESTTGSITINSGVTLSAGKYLGTGSSTSTNMLDFDITALQKGGINIAAKDTLQLNNGVLRSYGDNIALKSDVLITGSNPTMFAQGGDILMSAPQITLNGAATITAVARYTGGAAMVTSTGYASGAFQGGGIALYGNTGSIDLQATLAGMRNNMLPTGIQTLSASTTLGGAPIVNGGYIYTHGINNLGALRADGGVIWVDPVSIAFGSLLAFGPSLVPIAPADPTTTSSSSSSTSGTTPAATSLLSGPVVAAAITTAAAAASSPPMGSGAVISVDTTGPTSAVLPAAFVGPPPVPPATMITLDDSAPSTGKVVSKEQDANHTGATARSIADTAQWDPSALQTQYIVVSPCQRYLIQDRDSMGALASTVVASAGTMLEAPAPATSTADRTLSLKTGKMVVVAGQKQGMRVRTAHGTVELPAQSISVIEQKASGTMRVSFVSGGGAATVALHGGVVDDQLSVKAGEEIILGDDSDDEEFIPVDGVDRSVVSASIIKANGTTDGVSYGTGSESNVRISQQKLRAQKNRFRSEQMNQREKLLSPCTNDRELSMSLKVPEVSATSHFKPVGAVAPAAAAPINTALRTITSDIALVKHTASSQVTFEKDDTINIKDGELLLWARKPMVVKSQSTTVEVDGNSIVSVRSTPEVVAIRNIVDAHDRAIRVGVGKFAVDVKAGQEVLILASAVSPIKVLRKDGIARRAVRNFEPARSNSVVLSDVSFLTLVQASSVLRSVTSAQTGADRALGDKIIKSIAALTVTTGRRGPYALLKN